MDAQQGLADAGKVGRRIGNFQRRQVDIGEDRIAQHLRQPPRIVAAIVACEIGDVELVTARETQQQRHGERALVALEQCNITGRDFEVFGHGMLGEPQLAPEPFQPWAEVERLRFSHLSRFVIITQLYKENM